MASWLLCLAHKQNPRIPWVTGSWEPPSPTEIRQGVWTQLHVSKGNHLPTKPQFAYCTWFTLCFRFLPGFRDWMLMFFVQTIKEPPTMLHHFEGWNVSMMIMSSAGTAEVPLLKVAWIPDPKIAASQRDFCNFNLPTILRFAIQNHQKKQNPEWCCDFTKNSMEGFLSTTLA